jgi:hypothetical protein
MIEHTHKLSLSRLSDATEGEEFGNPSLQCPLSFWSLLGEAYELGDVDNIVGLCGRRYFGAFNLRTIQSRPCVKHRWMIQPRPRQGMVSKGYTTDISSLCGKGTYMRRKSIASIMTSQECLSHYCAYSTACETTCRDVLVGVCPVCLARRIHPHDS